MRIQKSFVALAVLLFAAALPIHAAPASRLAYAQQCAAKMGAIPAFNCMTGKKIPITKNDVEQFQPLPGEDCDRPVQLGLGGTSQCVPYSRLLRLNTGNANVETVAICRSGATEVLERVARQPQRIATRALCMIGAAASNRNVPRTVFTKGPTSSPEAASAPGFRWVRFFSS